jgi:hypothetical protein
MVINIWIIFYGSQNCIPKFLFAFYYICVFNVHNGNKDFNKDFVISQHYVWIILLKVTSTNSINMSFS